MSRYYKRPSTWIWKLINKMDIECHAILAILIIVGILAFAAFIISQIAR